MAVMQLAASERQLLKMIMMFVLIGNCQNKGVKSQFFGECGKSKNVRRRKERENEYGKTVEADCKICEILKKARGEA